MSVPLGRVRSVGTRRCRMLASRCPRQASSVRSTQQRAARSGEHGQDVGGELGGGVELSDGSEERGDVIEALDLLLGSLDGVVVDETQLFGLHPARPDRDVDPSRATTRRLRVDQGRSAHRLCGWGVVHRGEGVSRHHVSVFWTSSPYFIDGDPGE